jgi:hypothetical protein
MKETTPEEVKKIIEENGISFEVENPKYVDDMTPELRKAISDIEAFEKYLDNMDGDKVTLNPLTDKPETLNGVSEYFKNRFRKFKE